MDHFRPVDVSGVQVEGETLKDSVVWFINSGSTSAAERETLVARLGGRVSSRSSAVQIHCADAPLLQSQAHSERTPMKFHFMSITQP